VNRTQGRRVAAAFVLAMAAAVWLALRPGSGDCNASGATESGVYRIAPSRIVVRPWYGPHHVYGIFVVPNRFNDRRYSVSLGVDGVTREIVRRRLPEKTYVDTTLATPGHYLRRVFVPTRMALWFLLTGRFGELRTPCQWELVFADRRI
jgi:hypothetical protein